MAGCCAAASAFAEGDAAGFQPAQRPISRYEHIWTSSPFVAASTSTQAEQPLASRFGLTGYARFNGGEVAFLFDRVKLQRFSVSKDQGEGDVRLLSVEDTGDIKALRVKIKAGSETGELGYDASLATAGVSGPDQNLQAAVPVPPPVPPPTANTGRPGVNPGSPVRPPRVIRRRPIVNQQN